MISKELIVDESFVEKCNFGGRGGKENQVIACFKNNLIKENGELFDCVDAETGKKYELKKQKNLQWLDPRKFFNLSEDDKNITMVFLLYDSLGFCDIIATIKLGSFVEQVYSKEHLESAKYYAKKFPKDQIKSGIKIRDFLKNYDGKMNILWQRKKHDS